MSNKKSYYPNLTKVKNWNLCAHLIKWGDLAVAEQLCRQQFAILVHSTYLKYARTLHKTFSKISSMEQSKQVAARLTHNYAEQEIASW